jgi:hypothetical protein
VPIYEWADLRLSTDFELPELPAADAAGEPWTVDCREGRAPLVQPRRWFQSWRKPDGRRGLSFARFPGGYLLRFSGLADFELRPDARQIHGYRAATTPAHTFNHLLLDQVLPLAVPGASRLSLHASVVDVDGEAVAFLGATRQGKSTLAAALARRGHPVISDDCCVLRRTAAGFDVYSTYAGLRLFPETVRRVFGEPERPPAEVAHYSTKQRIVPDGAGGSFSPRRLPLGAFYAIGPRDTSSASAAAVRITPRTSRESVFDIIGVTFVLDVEDGGRAREGFELAVQAASQYPVRVLSMPWDLGALDAVADAIVGDRRG